MKVRTRPIVNARKKPSRPSRIDPTRTATLRTAFARKLRQRFARIKLALRRLVAEEDAFGLGAREGATVAELMRPTPTPRLALRNAFCATGSGGGVDPSCSAGESSGKGSKVAALAERLRGLPAAAAKAIKDKAAAKYKQLEARYGGKYAKAILGAALLGVPLPLPGASFVTAAPVLAIAEMHRYLTVNAFTRNARELTSEEIRAAAEELWEELRKEFAALPVANQRWRFHSDPEKVRAFQAWLKTQFAAEVLGDDERALWEAYVRQGYAKGAGRAWDDSSGYRPKRWSPGEGDFTTGSRAQFLRDSFARPETVEKVQLLAGRSFSDLEGVTEQMSRVMTRTLTDALVQGMNPLGAARLLEDNVDGIGRARAETIARMELIRAHAEGQLDAFEDLGVEELGVAAEWLITEDDKVCPQCESLSGVVLTLEEARQYPIPRHPGCRCAWIPANVGETDKQKDTKGKIDKAVRKSRDEDEDWGAGGEVARERPRGIFNRIAHSTFGRLLLNAFCPTGAGGEIARERPRGLF